MFDSLLDEMGISSDGLVYVIEKPPESRQAFGRPSPSLQLVPLALALLQADESSVADDIVYRKQTERKWMIRRGKREGETTTEGKDPLFFAASSWRTSDFEEADKLETQPVVTDAVLKHCVLAEVDLDASDERAWRSEPQAPTARCVPNSGGTAKRPCDDKLPCRGGKASPSSMAPDVEMRWMHALRARLLTMTCHTLVARVQRCGVNEHAREDLDEVRSTFYTKPPQALVLRMRTAQLPASRWNGRYLRPRQRTGGRCILHTPRMYLGVPPSLVCFRPPATEV
ncbi:hypothetical protein CMUS01_07374 [Colletotrichum musicola]|uniref:Uncharacterized protein n=1 Tax=Colletotrichum musicola TaxID=2175873 RepID=A0A8H6NG69_9PEZI|nr:hypothetical protein CMUS01_07374 [Colletotrichum musicola]